VPGSFASAFDACVRRPLGLRKWLIPSLSSPVISDQCKLPELGACHPFLIGHVKAMNGDQSDLAAAMAA
jgi:hypothetical protein